MKIQDVRLSDFTYTLPEERIAQTPLAQRDCSKLLHYDGQGALAHHHFYELPDLLSGKWGVFMNNTKVIPARLFFRKSTGGLIEVFLLNPVAPSAVIPQVMEETEGCTWHCMIGNLKRMKEGQPLNLELEDEKQHVFNLTATLEDREKRLVRFTWSGKHAFADVLEAAGKLPLPPYIQREATEEDKDNYQTVFAQNKGAVAAPTAGLHFTDAVLNQLKEKGHLLNELTLHVAAGTFRPVTEEEAHKHAMHAEQVIIRRENLEALLSTERRLVVGTTSMRTLESLYWFGHMLSENKNARFEIPKNYAWENAATTLSFEDSMQLVQSYMDEKRIDTLVGTTEIYILPGYTFRACDALITNFHMPGTTLILLIAAFVGEDWRKIYEAALQNDYRFLSYGDSSLLFRAKK